MIKEEYDIMLKEAYEALDYHLQCKYPKKRISVIYFPSNPYPYEPELIEAHIWFYNNVFFEVYRKFLYYCV